MSFHILIALLFVAVSCKSEVKPNPVVPDEIKKEQKNETTKDASVLTAIKEEKEVLKENTELKEAEEKTKTAVELVKSEQPIATEKEVVKKKENASVKKEKVVKTVTDKDIETETATDQVKKSTEVKNNVDEVLPSDTKPKQEVKEEIEEKTEKPAKPEKLDKPVGFPNHSILDGLLKTFVTSTGVVNYAGLKNKESKLDEYLKVLENMPPETTWNRDQELTYWINAYNAFTIKLILDNYPVKSITDLHGGKPWDVKWINLDGKNLSLNNIENDIIRPKYNEPRIHFAVNCAARSCPPLLNAAYNAKTLDAQLESQTKKFINNTAFNTLGKSEIEVSKIFEWYGVDFGDIASFVLRYADKTVKPSAKVSFKEYDWALNGK